MLTPVNIPERDMEKSLENGMRPWKRIQVSDTMQSSIYWHDSIGRDILLKNIIEKISFCSKEIFMLLILIQKNLEVTLK